MKRNKNTRTLRPVLELCEREEVECLHPTSNYDAAVYKVGEKGYWFFRCPCAKVFSPRLNNVFAIIENGGSFSCGCLKRRRSSASTWFDFLVICDVAKLTFLHPISNLSAHLYYMRDFDYWWFRCFCGNVFSTQLGHILSGHTKSCGCHGTRSTWQDVIDRCDELRFDFLHPISNYKMLTYNTHQYDYWNLRCFCGDRFTSAIQALIDGRISGCGKHRSKYIWQDVLDMCERLKFVFSNCPPNHTDQIYDVMKMDIWHFECFCGNTLSPSLLNLLHGHYTSCGCIRSKQQKEVCAYVASFMENVLKDDRKAIAPYELDVYLPDKKIAIEYCGNYWHGERHNGIEIAKSHLQEKWSLCSNEGIRLITIFGDEWVKRKEQVKRFIYAALMNDVDVKDCAISEIGGRDAVGFIEDNAICKYSAEHHYGVFMKTKLIGVVSFDRQNNYAKLIDYCGVLNGSVLKMILDCYCEDNADVVSIECLIDHRFGSEHIFLEAGFDVIGTHLPSYYYFHKDKLNKDRRDVFIERGLIDDNLSIEQEYEVMFKQKHDRIWDCGSTKMIKILDSTY